MLLEWLSWVALFCSLDVSLCSLSSDFVSLFPPRPPFPSLTTGTPLRLSTSPLSMSLSVSSTVSLPYPSSTRSLRIAFRTLLFPSSVSSLRPRRLVPFYRRRLRRLEHRLRLPQSQRPSLCVQLVEGLSEERRSGRSLGAHERMPDRSGGRGCLAGTALRAEGERSGLLHSSDAVSDTLFFTTQATNQGSGGTVSGTSVSTNSRSEWQVLAHEIGHNFGAVHDCASGCPAGATCCPLSRTTCDASGSFLMSPVSQDGESAFSPCTVGNVSPSSSLLFQSPRSVLTPSFLPRRSAR